jgi:hypothetical protein
MTLHVDKKPATAAEAKGSDAGTASMLSLQGVGFVIEGRTLLHPLTLDFAADKTVGLIAITVPENRRCCSPASNSLLRHDTLRRQ